MPNGMNDNLVIRDLVKDNIRVRRHRHPTNGRIARAAANVGMHQQEFGQSLNAGLYASRGLRRMSGDVSRIVLRSARAGRL
jgi:hypothetical protein